MRHCPASARPRVAAGWRLWLKVYRSREVFVSEREVTLTSEDIELRTDTTTIHLTWDKLWRVHESKHLWVFAANRETRIAVAKRALSRDQQADLAACIAARATQQVAARTGTAQSLG